MFPYIDYKIVSTVLGGFNSSSVRLIYTTEYPCLLFLEIEPGQIPGFNSSKSCYFDITYTGDQTTTVRTTIFQTANNFDAPEGSNPGYCQQAGVPIVFNTGDDDYSGTVRLHIMRLPTSQQVQGG